MHQRKFLEVLTTEIYFSSFELNNKLIPPDNLLVWCRDSFGVLTLVIVLYPGIFKLVRDQVSVKNIISLDFILLIKSGFFDLSPITLRKRPLMFHVAIDISECIMRFFKLNKKLK